MLIDWLAQKLFPRHNPALRPKEMGVLVMVIVTALVMAATVGILMIYFNSRRHG